MAQIAVSKKPSEALKTFLEKLKGNFADTSAMIMAAYNRCIEEGFTPKESRALLVNFTGLNDRTIRNYLPAEAKRPYDNTKRQAESKEHVSDLIDEKIAQLGRFNLYVTEERMDKIASLCQAGSPFWIVSKKGKIVEVKDTIS